MKQKMSIILCMLALLSSAVFIHAESVDVKWLDVTKADFLDENSELLVYTKGDFGTGLMDLEGNDVVEYDQYKEIKLFEPYVYTVSKNPFYDDSDRVKNSYQDFFKLFYKGGQIFKSYDFEYVGNFKEDLLVAKKNGKYGYIDIYGKTIIDFKFDYAEDFTKGLAVVGEKKGNIMWYGLINKRGVFIFKMNNDEIIRSDDETFLVCYGGLYNYYDLSGKKISQKFYKYASKFSGDYSVVGEKDSKNAMKYGLVNKKGVRVIAPKYDGIFPFDTKFAVFMKKEGKNVKYGLIDLNDNKVLEADYDSIGTFSEHFCTIGKEGKLGYINSDAKIICDFKYENAKEFKNGMAAVKKSGKWGYIDVNMKEIIPFQYDKADHFEEGLAIVKQNNRYGIIDKKGKWIVNQKYDSLVRISQNRFIGKRSGNYDLILKDGSILLKDYDYINYSGSSYLVKKFDKYGIVVDKKTIEHKPQISLSDFNIRVDGKQMKSSAYLIDGSSYVRIRDVAELLKNSKSKFNVEYQKEFKQVHVYKNANYKDGSGSQLKPIDKNTVLKKSFSPLYIGGVAFNLDSYLINGNNFYKLRDLGVSIGFKVQWDQRNKMISVTGE